MRRLFRTFDDVEKIDIREIRKLDELAWKRVRKEQPRAAFVVGITTNYGNCYRALIVVPRAYPLKAPAAYVLKPGIRGRYEIAHIYYGDGRCCLFEEYGRDWNADECDLVTITSWVAVWLFCQEFFQRNGYWPAPESHKTTPRPRTRPWDARIRR